MKRKQIPKVLEKAGRRFWKKVLLEYNFEEAHHFEILRVLAQGACHVTHESNRPA